MKKFKLKKQKVKAEPKLEIKNVPTIDYKFSVPGVYQYNPENRAELIQAGYAEIGSRYVSSDYNSVMELLSKDTQDTGDMRAWKLKFKAYFTHGDLIEVNTNGLSPLVVDQKSVGKIMEKYIQGVNYMADKKGIKVKASMDKTTGKVVKTSERRASTNVDPKTGCRAGTTAQIVGSIMLRFKEGAEHRSKVLPLIQKELQDQGFDEKKSKALAASWYTTLVKRKPEIYGKFAGAKNAAPVKSDKKEKPVKKLKVKKEMA